MSEEPKLPAMTDWILYALLGLAGSGGLISGGATMIDRIAPRVDEHSVDLRVLVRQVNRHEEQLERLTLILESSESNRARAKALLENHEVRLHNLEQMKATMGLRLDDLKVDLKVLCRTLDAPCGR